MTIEPQIKKNWEELQTKFNYPVDAIGRPIDPQDEETLSVWQTNGIDQFLKD